MQSIAPLVLIAAAVETAAAAVTVVVVVAIHRRNTRSNPLTAAAIAGGAAGASAASATKVLLSSAFATSAKRIYQLSCGFHAWLSWDCVAAAGTASIFSHISPLLPAPRSCSEPLTCCS